MIKAEIYKDNKGHIKRYIISGHAGYDVYGKDIVCAAVSVLAQTTLLSLVKVCGLEENTIRYSIDEESGFLDVELPREIDTRVLGKTQVLLESFLVGINSIKESYPEHITLK